MLALRIATLLAAGGILWLASVVAIIGGIAVATREEDWQAELDEDDVDEAIRRILEDPDQ